MFPIQIAQHSDNLSKVVGAILFNTDYPILWYIKQSCWSNLPTPPSSFLRRCDGNFECEFSVKYGGLT